MARKQLKDYAPSEGATMTIEAERSPDDLKQALMKPTGTLTLSNSGRTLLEKIESIERLVEDQKALAEDISEIKRQIKDEGFDIKAVGDLMKLRAMGESKARERLQTLKFYAESVGVNVFPD